MKLCEAPTKIIGIQVGELNLDLIRGGGIPKLKVRFALVTDEGPASFMDVGDFSQWSSKTTEAMRAFTEALEEEALGLIFKVAAQGTETPRVEGRDEPAQF